MICMMLLLDLCVGGSRVVIEIDFLFFAWNLEIGAWDLLSSLTIWFNLMSLHYFFLLNFLVKLRFT